MKIKTTTNFFTKLILCIFPTFLIGYYFGHSFAKIPTGDSFSTFSDIKKIVDLYQPTPPISKILDNLKHAYVDSYGDRYTQYFSPEEVLSFQTMIDGDFEGIGAYVEDDSNGIYISGVLPGSPAQEAGLLPGDLIQMIDNETTHAKTAHEAVKKIRGKAGTPVVLEVFSTIMGTKKQVTLLRRHLEIPIIQDSIQEDVLIIQLFSFNDHSRDDVENVLQKHKGKYSKVLLDLRNNGGGTLQSAVDVGSLFLDKGKIIASVKGTEDSLYVSHGESDFQLPLFILINGQTASAAEILTAALHFHLNAPIFGSQSYGKGSVQQLFSLPDGGEIKVTIAHWYTPDNRILDGVGINPTQIILPTIEDITTAKDGQLRQTITTINALSTQK